MNVESIDVTVESENFGPDEQRTDGPDERRADGELSTPETQRRVTWADVIKNRQIQNLKKEKTSNR